MLCAKPGTAFFFEILSAAQTVIHLKQHLALDNLSDCVDLFLTDSVHNIASLCMGVFSYETIVTE